MVWRWNWAKWRLRLVQRGALILSEEQVGDRSAAGAVTLCGNTTRLGDLFHSGKRLRLAEGRATQDCAQGAATLRPQFPQLYTIPLIVHAEVGVNLQPDYMVRYEFDQSSGSIATDEETIIIGFSTQLKKGILMQITNGDPVRPDYISIEVNNNGACAHTHTHTHTHTHAHTVGLLVGVSTLESRDSPVRHLCTSIPLTEWRTKSTQKRVLLCWKISSTCTRNSPTLAQAE